MLKQLEYRCRNAKVYFRCTPNLGSPVVWDYVKVLSDKRTIYVRCLQDFLMGNERTVPNYWCFETDGIFYNDSQQDIYQAIMPEVLQRFLDGADATIIAYGATGTGKSLTISAIENSFEDRGLIFRALDDLIRLREERKNKMKVTYSMSFIEATNIRVYDLLDENVPAYGGNSMKYLKKIVVTNLQNALVHIFKGEGRKSTNKKASYTSHASHSVLTITASCRLIDEVKPLQVVSKLHFVDLAGVDTVGNESSFYKNVIEIGMANVTKSQIEQFVLTLVDNITEHILVKQKLNILIQYLGNALSHSSQMRLIGHIRTRKKDLMMTLSMLRLGNIVRGLKSKKIGTQVKETKEGKIKHLQQTVDTMRQELVIQSMILNNSLSKNLNQDRLCHLQQLAESYLSNKINELVVVSFSDVNTILQVFKDRFLDLETKKKEEVDAAYQSAYEKALESFKSMKKTSSVKSKESITQSQTSRTSKRSLSWKGSKLSTDSKEKGRRGSAKDGGKQGSAKKSPPTSLTTLETKSAKTGSKTIRKSLKKRSSVVSETIDEASEVVDQLLPEDVPASDQAWNEFTADEKYGYATLKAQLDENEKNAKDINVKYLNEVRNLNETKEMLESVKETSQFSQMGREIIGSTRVDEEGNVKLSNTETDQKNLIKQIELNILTQQENLLYRQSELRLQLEICRQNRKSINELYEQFCSEKYKTLLPDVQEKSTEDTLLQQVSVNDTETRNVMTKDLSESYNNLVRYESLKNIMQRQKIKMKRREIQNRKWLRSCKP